MSLTRRQPKVDIQIVKTEYLKQGETALEDRSPESAPPDLVINIVGKQQLREQFTSEELQHAAEQARKQLLELAAPQIILDSQQLRQSWRIDEAILLLRGHVKRSGTSPEIEAELARCLRDLDTNTYFQRIANGQLAAILFDAAGFSIMGKEPLQSLQNQGLVETRMTLVCDDENLGIVLETIASSPLRYYCYCLAEFDRPLDNLVLGVLQLDFVARERNVNSLVHFVVCKESSPATNMFISFNRFTQRFITIPLERHEMRRAILTGASADYVQGKVSTWMDNHRLYATTRPVTRQGEFFGREQELKQIADVVNRGQSFYVIGSRRMGKTSLIRHMESLGAFRGNLYAFLGLDGLVGQPDFQRGHAEILQQWMRDLARRYPELAQSIQSRLESEASPHERLALFLDALRSAVYEGGQADIKALLVLDDINLLFVQDEGPALWDVGAKALIRLLRQRDDVVTTGMLLWDLSTSDRLELGPAGGLGKYTTIYVGPLHRAACDTMVTYIGGIINMEYSPDSLAALYAEAGGQPFWTRLLCDNISRTRPSSYECISVTPDLVQYAVQEFLGADRRFLELMRQGLSGAEHRVLTELARAADPIRGSELAGAPSLKTLTALKHYGLIEQDPVGSDKYRIRMRLLTRYLKSR